MTVASAQGQRLLLDRQIWPAITTAATRARRRTACIAYLGHEAAALLPLRHGDVCVVDASDRALLTGTTDPHAIAVWLRAGASIYSLPGLHAKVIITDDVAFVGSANASRRSADHLFEAVIQTSDRTLVAAARRYIDGLTNAATVLDGQWLSTKAPLFRMPQTEPTWPLSTTAEDPDVGEVVWILEGTDRSAKFHSHASCHGMKQQQAKDGHRHRRALPVSRTRCEKEGRSACDLPNCWR